MKKKIEKKEEFPKKWITKTIDVLLPEDGYGMYVDIFSYLAKVVDTGDSKYRYIIGLLNCCFNSDWISQKQKKLATDVIDFFRVKGYFEEN